MAMTFPSYLLLFLCSCNFSWFSPSFSVFLPVSWICGTFPRVSRQKTCAIMMENAELEKNAATEVVPFVVRHMVYRPRPPRPPLALNTSNCIEGRSQL